MKKTSKSKKEPKEKVKKTRKSKTNTKKKGFGRIVLIAIMGILIFFASCALVFALYIIITSPKFDVNKLYSSSSSIILDSDGNAIAELGVQKRDNVTYDELPDVLVDAIVATEDSKYFQHNGVDLMRFTKAVIGQLAGQSGAGGASTLTMQVVKNTYNGRESSGIKGIIRKFKDIYMAVFKVEKAYTKQEIIEFYVNQPFLGSQSYGVQQASETYFGKDVSELNLSEAALLAGLFQAPSAYDPYYYPEAAQSRRNIVLSLMVRHKYITKEEADIAKSIPVSDLLVGQHEIDSEYQGFIETVVNDVIKKTKQSPYTTSMTIYSTMKKSKQDAINDLYAGKTYTWVNDTVQCGIAVTSAKDGSVVAVGTGRNRNVKMSYNYATDIKRQPGSTAKPIFDYGPAMEYAGWGTGTTVNDNPYKYSNGTPIHDVDGRYMGIMTAKTALAKSRNIPALQAFQATSQTDKYEFVTNLGITPELHSGQILESSSIGAFTGVSPLELSAAYGAFARGGYYIEPYTFTKIVYNDTKETYTYTPTKKKAMSEETAFMINMILTYAVTSNNISAGSVSGTNIASKTGTASIDYKAMGLPSSAISDAWQVAYSPDYAIATWYGYDTSTRDKYLTESEGWAARRLITHALVAGIMEKNSTWKKPDGVVQVTIEIGSIPTQLANAYTPANLKSVEYFRKGTEPTETSNRYSQLPNVTNLSYTAVTNVVTLSWSAINPPEVTEAQAAMYGNLEYDIYKKGSDGNLTKIASTTSTSYTTKVDSPSTTFVVRAAYSSYKTNASSGVEVTVKIDSIISGGGADEQEGGDTENPEGGNNEQNGQ